MTTAPAFIAYYRVSTQAQGRSGLGLEAQREAVARHAATLGGQVVQEFTEVESGKRNDRPQLAAALAACRAQGAVLCIAKLDRLARNARFLLSVVEGAGEAGVAFCDLPQLPPGPAGRFMLTMFAAVAELEAGMISQGEGEGPRRPALRRSRSEGRGLHPAADRPGPRGPGRPHSPGRDALGARSGRPGHEGRGLISVDCFSAGGEFPALFYSEGRPLDPPILGEGQGASGDGLFYTAH